VGVNDIRAEGVEEIEHAAHGLSGQGGHVELTVARTLDAENPQVAVFRVQSRPVSGADQHHIVLGGEMASKFVSDPAFPPSESWLKQRYEDDFHGLL
jgi:hypothetical protein